METFKQAVMEFIAKELAEANRDADVYTYVENQPIKAWARLTCTKSQYSKLMEDLGLDGKEIETLAFKTYDYRNSGKEGYTLKDGKIVIDPEILAQENEELIKEELIKKVAELEYLLNQITLRFNPPRCG